MSPFEKHREKLVGNYSTAAWLRKVVLAMYNGGAYPVGLSRLTNVDADHMLAFQELTSHYHRHGESDVTFMRIAEECLAIEERHTAARARAERFDPWTDEVRGALARRGLNADDAESAWFEKRFDAGDSAEAAATEWAKQLPTLEGN